MNYQIYLLGGPPGAGKTTLGNALANRLGFTSLSCDDLVAAVQSVTTPATHPDLHLMWQARHTDYFTNNTPENLIEDARKQHIAAWPLIRSVIRRHASSGSPIVIDGWHIWPEWVAALELPAVWAGWLHIDPAILRKREESNTGWLEGSMDPGRMLDNFMARSLWYNETLRQEALKYHMPVLHQDGTRSVEDLCDEVLAL